MYQDENKKPWQHGYDLEYLLSLQKNYEKYNEYAKGPFAEFKKHHIADGLHKETLELTKQGGVQVIQAKQRTPITMHGDVAIGRKEPGDIFFSHISTHNKETREVINADKMRKKYCWMQVWSEWPEANAFAEECGFKKVGMKFTTFAEIYTLYFRDARGKPEREHQKILEEEKISIAKCQPKFDVEKIQQELSKAQFEYTNHYSNYNQKGTWAAIALRGYGDSPGMIEKPVEMNKKWKAENPGWQLLEVQDTDIIDHFPATMELVESLPTDNIVHRVRFMRLKPGGTLGRHTDQVDPDVGVRDGRLMRLHIPIHTNKHVFFYSWDANGAKHTVNMAEGACWYLDTRKPHEATNGGKEDRVHLVIDVEACSQARGLTRI
jgi:hypothetical protein